MKPPKVSVCIPAYNRASVLPALLDSILTQDYDDYDIVICEDCSPQREQIRTTVERYAQQHPGRIHYFENDKNLGYDGNIRNLVEQADGEYCLFMGNDDLMCASALARVATALERHPNIGVVLRSYAAFEGTPDNVVQTFRYFDREIFFPAGERTIGTVFRRSVVIPGMVVQRAAARKYATDRFDGILLYQLYLVASILVEMNAVYLPDVIVLYRNGGIPDFGNSEAERGKFVPTEHTPESSLHFMQGMLDIARHVEQTRSVLIYKAILRDIGNYSYPILAIQADKPLPIFLRYYRGLSRMGLWRVPLFHVYLVLILLLGTRRLERLINWVKRRLGHTPAIGKVYQGEGR
ncbi:MAG: glycosyltransferase family 2 protein [Pseudomonadota bacterium]